MQMRSKNYVDDRNSTGVYLMLLFAEQEKYSIGMLGRKQRYRLRENLLNNGEVSMFKEVTLVVVPRDHFSHAKLSLESILSHTSIPYDMIYVDHSAPKHVSDWLRKVSTERHINHVLIDRPLTPNEARNIAIPEVKTPYIVFIDNDVIVTPGWLEPLLNAAKTKGAWLTGPTYLIGDLSKGRIHMTGGTVGFNQNGNRRLFEETHCHLNERYDEVRELLKPGETELVEFHCMLVKRSIFDHVGLLDEKLMAQAENLDFCMAAKEAGGIIYLEPASVITYLPPVPLQNEDVKYFLLRWSDKWARSSLEYFRSKRGIERDDPYLNHQRSYLTHMRRRALRYVAWPLGRMLERVLYKKHIGSIVEPMVTQLEHALIRQLEGARVSDLNSSV